MSEGASMIGQVEKAAIAVDPLDPVAAPFGTFSPSERLLAARRLATSDRPPHFIQRWLYKGFSHFTKQRGLILDLDYLGGKFRLFVDENGQDRWVFRRGHHPEEEELLGFSAYAGKDIVFLDIGANNGYFAVSAGHRIGKGSRILSFEPHPRTFRKLMLHLAFNDAPQVEPLNLALGPEETTMTLHASATADGCNTLVGDGADGVPVPVRPLTDVLAERGIERVDLLKIDVEGFEDHVLFPFFENAPASLWPERVIIEKTNQQRSWRRDCLGLMTERGYRIDRQTMDNAWLSRPLPA